MYKNRFSLILGLTVFVTLFSGTASSEIVIIGNKSMPSGIIDAATAKKLWLGKSKKISGIGKIKILDQDKSSAIRNNFYKKVTNKNSSQIKAYWAKIVFTGKALPPKSLSSDSDVIELVRNSSNVIGYVDSASVDDTVKVLYTVK